MSNNGEGIGHLTAEDIAAMRGEQPQESVLDYVRRMITESEEKLAAAEKEAVKAQVLGRAVVLAAPYLDSSVSKEDIAVAVFNMLEALDAEYERRQRA